MASIFDSLKTSNLDFEVIVIDNGSTDGSCELLNKKFPRVKKIFNKENLGYGKSNNLGIQKAKGEFIFLLNSDIKVLDEGIDKLFVYAQDHPRTFVGAKLLNEDNSPQASCGPMYTLPVVFFMLFLKGDSLGITRSSPAREKSVDWVSGACLMGKKENFLNVGLFDEAIFMYMDEIDFLYRARQKGYTTAFYPQARFIHTGAASSADRRQPVLNIYRGLLYFYRKHRSIMEERLLRIMLIAKALLAIQLGRLTGNQALISTYEQALQLV